MKKKILIILMLCIVGFSNISFLAKSVPYDTYMESSSYGLSFAAPLYTPAGTLPYSFTQLNDLYVSKDNSIYVADGAQVERFDTDGTGYIYTNSKMENAAGIFVDEELNLYVADDKAQDVFVFDYAGNLIKEYERPTEVYFGESTPYAPTNVVKSPNGKIYITSTGTTDGIITLTEDGRFLGFFGANESNKSIYSFDMMTNSKLASFFRPTPASVTNIAIDERGSVYTSTYGLDDGVRRLNYSSEDTYEDFENTSEAIEDIYIDKYGNILMLNTDLEAPIVLNDSNGEFLFAFGEISSVDSQLGVLKTPTAIAVDNDMNIYVADTGLNEVVVFTPTTQLTQLLEASYLFYEANYKDANVIWDSLLNSGLDVSIGYESLGMENKENKEYQQSLEYFRKSENTERYSDSLYFVREDFLNDHLLTIVIVLVVLFVLNKLRKRYLKIDINKYKVLKTISDFHKFNMHMLFNPADAFYEIKYKAKVSYKHALVVYLLGFIAFLFTTKFTSFLFKLPVEHLNIVSIFIVFVIGLNLIIISNHLVSTISFGEATLGLLYKSFAFILIPFIYIAPILTVVSNCLTLNEAFVFVFFTGAYIIWAVYILISLIGEIHNFMIGDVYKNLLLTIFTIIVLVAVFATLVYLANGLIGTFTEIIKEVLYR